MSEPEKKRLAVIGHPVAHSRSPEMQEAALGELEKQGLEGEWSYVALDFSPEEFAQRIHAMEGEGFVGANVTIPHKEAALALADTSSSTAQTIGAANTLCFVNGEVVADNTDAFGLLSALEERRVGPAGVRALVLGAGGAARAVIWALAKRGAAVYVWNRHEGRARDTYDQLGQHIDLGGAPVESPKQENYGIIVNTTSIGLHGEEPSEHLPIDPSKLGGHVVVDLAYSDGPTELIEVAKQAGATTVDGIDILVHQGARSLEIWTDEKAPIDVMRKAAREGLSR
jgi:shikimate dehydrogenase